MNKSQLLYNATSEFESNKEILETKRHYTAETLDNKYIHFKNKKIKLPIKPVEESLAADICLIENNTLEKYIVDGNSYSVDLFPSEQYTPIGVVVVPASHTDDGTARVISLASMDYNNPDNGNTDGNVSIYYNKSSILPTLTNIPIIANSSNNLGDKQEIKTWVSNLGYLSSDIFLGNNQLIVNPFDTESAYGDGGNMNLIPSPYLEDGTINQCYRTKENSLNRFNDLDGKGNTNQLIESDNNESTNWQTAQTLNNTSSSFVSAQCCWRYHTVGTNQGDWYLPSIGELGYLSSRFKLIQNAIQKIIDNGFNGLLINNSNLFSSTNYSSMTVNILVISYNYHQMIDSFIGQECNVRAFLKV